MSRSTRRKNPTQWIKADNSVQMRLCSVIITEQRVQKKEERKMYAKSGIDKIPYADIPIDKIPYADIALCPNSDCRDTVQPGSNITTHFTKSVDT